MPREINRLAGNCGSRDGRDLEVDVTGAGAGAIRQELVTNGEEGADGDESSTPASWEETPEAKTLDVGVG